MIKTLFIPLFLTTVLAVSSAADVAPYELKPNDRVVFLGDALFERDIAYNYLETMLTVRFHGKGITFRNIGWSGDTVWGESRAVFGSQKDGYNSLVKAINETKPNVVFINYGMNESFAGPDGLKHFEEGYNALLDSVLNPAKDAEHVAAAPAQAKDRKNKNEVLTPAAAEQRPVPRVVLISPIAFQNNETNVISRNSKANENLASYTAAIKKIAAQRGTGFVDVFTAFQAAPKRNGSSQNLTADGLHLTAAGYLVHAEAVQKGLGLRDAKWNFDDEIDGVYNHISDKPKTSTMEKMRALIAAKNQQFFNKWRPQNETYLFLFRKHEQGRNAKEIPEFDPFIAAKENEIQQLADNVAKEMGL